MFSERGINVKMPWAKAVSLRFSMYALRKKEREETQKFYKPGDLEYGKSPWDELQVGIQEIDGTDREAADRQVYLQILKNDFSLDQMDITDPFTGEKI